MNLYERIKVWQGEVFSPAAVLSELIVDADALIRELQALCAKRLTRAAQTEDACGRAQEKNERLREALETIEVLMLGDDPVTLEEAEFVLSKIDIALGRKDHALKEST